MPKLKKLSTYKDARGNLTVIEKTLPFEIKRVYYIYDVKGKERGFHSHKKTQQALIAVHGSCQIHIKTNDIINSFKLDSPDKCLILEPQDYHWMNSFSKNAVLLVLASHYFDKNDYIE